MHCSTAVGHRADGSWSHLLFSLIYIHCAVLCGAGPGPPCRPGTLSLRLAPWVGMGAALFPESGTQVGSFGDGCLAPLGVGRGAWVVLGSALLGFQVCSVSLRFCSVVGPSGWLILDLCGGFKHLCSAGFSHSTLVFCASYSLLSVVTSLELLGFTDDFGDRCGGAPVLTTQVTVLPGVI